MRKDADDAVREKDKLESTLKAIEAKAQSQYEADLKEMASQATKQAAKLEAPQECEPGPPSSHVEQWKFDSSSGYYYNEVHRYYHDTKSGYYYGGDPPEWVLNPPIPSESKFNKSCSEGAATASAPAAPEGPQHMNNTAEPSSSSTTELYEVRTVKLSVPSHPLAAIGGHSIPSVGHVGGAKNLVTNRESKGSSKRKREEKSGAGPVDKEEEEARARREAARARVQQRTMANFGLG